MKGLGLSRAGSGLVRAILQSRLEPGHRILLTQVRSVDWQSLTFVGERHEIGLRMTGPDATAIAGRFVAALPETEFCIAGHIIADIAGTIAAKDRNDSVLVAIEALTIAAN